MPEGKLREALVKESQVSENPFKCPTCGNTDVTLDGKYQRRFQKEFHAGQEAGVKLDLQYTERYTAINCYACGRRFEIEPDHIVALYVDNMELKMKLATQTGMAVRQPMPKDRVM